MLLEKFEIEKKIFELADILRNIGSKIPFDIDTFTDLEDIIYCPNGVHIVNMPGPTNCFEDEEHYHNYLSELEPISLNSFEYNIRNGKYIKMPLCFVYNGRYDTETAEPFYSFVLYENFIKSVEEIFNILDFFIDNGMGDIVDLHFSYIFEDNDKIWDLFSKRNAEILVEELKTKKETKKIIKI